MRLTEAAASATGTTGSSGLGSCEGKALGGGGMCGRPRPPPRRSRWIRTHNNVVPRWQPPAARSQHLPQWHARGTVPTEATVTADLQANANWFATITTVRHARQRANQHATIADAPTQRHRRLAALVVPAFQRATAERLHLRCATSTLPSGVGAKALVLLLLVVTSRVQRNYLPPGIIDNFGKLPQRNRPSLQRVACPVLDLRRPTPSAASLREVYS